MRKQLSAAVSLAVVVTILARSPVFSQGNNEPVLHQVKATATLEPRAYLPLVVSNFPFFELGGHVNDLNLPYATRMHYAGMNWVKSQVYYQQDASSVIAAAHNNGLKIQLTALGTADMVTHPGFEQDFANWASSLAAVGADAIEIWKEPNIDREWATGHISPTLYTNLLCTSYNAINAVYSDTLVISAAPLPTGYFGGCTSNGCDDLPWIEGLYAANAGDCMDYIGAHHYIGATSPSARSGHPLGLAHHSFYFLWQTEEYYQAFQSMKPLFYTEMGYASQEGVSPFHAAFSWASGTTNAEQAAWLTEAAQLSMSTGMVHYIMIWNIDFPRVDFVPQDGYAIIRPDDSCPSCEALHGLLGSR